MIARKLRRLIARAGLAYLALPLGVSLGSSFTATPYLAFPPQGWTLEWYRTLLVEAGYVAAFTTSTVLALAATVAAVVLTVPAALAVARYEFPGKAALTSVLMSPLVLPHILPVAVDRAHRHHRAVRAAFNTDPADAGAARAGRGFRGPGRQPLDHVLPGGAAADPAGHRDRFHLRVHLVMDQRGAFHLQHHGGPEHHPREAFQLRAVHDRSVHRSRIGRHDRGCVDRHLHS
ncbi:hypothetical protein G6F22_017460 [Rhizopus arrhizus]|nr:hypothetical protein G6F22_017460 [Rhizopus arrhizus]